MPTGNEPTKSPLREVDAGAVAEHLHVHGQHPHVAASRFRRESECSGVRETPRGGNRHVIQHAALEYGLLQPVNLGGVRDVDRHEGRAVWLVAVTGSITGMQNAITAEAALSFIGRR
ncbi:MAG: hypothetical protein AABZ29_06375 [Gemmatimonadota bacterium]